MCVLGGGGGVQVREHTVRVCVCVARVVAGPVKFVEKTDLPTLQEKYS